MGNVEIFIRATSLIVDEESVELLLSTIFAFLFLPINASRENPIFTGQAEIDHCVHRREEILKALKEIISKITDVSLISEVVTCLEICQQLPIVRHKALILEICKNIQVVGINEVKKIEDLIRKILNQHEELRENALEAWSWTAIKYSEIVTSDVLDERIDVNLLQGAIGRFFKYCTQENAEITLRSLEKLWTSTENSQFSVVIAHQVLEDFWTLRQYEKVLQFLHGKSINELAQLGKITSKIVLAIEKYDSTAVKIISILEKFPTNSMLFNCFLPSVAKIFQLRKEEFSTEEVNFLAETIKILMTVFIKSSEKSRIANGLLPLFLCVYHKSYPIQISKSVSKAISYISTTCKSEYSSFANTLGVQEQKYLESQLFSASSTSVAQSVQPTITLQLKFKKS